MKKVYRKPRFKSLSYGSAILGHRSHESVNDPQPRRNWTQKLAQDRKKVGTKEELRFEQMLKTIDGGRFVGRFEREWAGPRIILDFFFPEARLGVEIDGGYHESPAQRLRDEAKASICKRLEITLVRFKNEDVVNDPAGVTKRFLEAWDAAYETFRGQSARAKKA